MKNKIIDAYTIYSEDINEFNQRLIDLIKEGYTPFKKLHTLERKSGFTLIMTFTQMMVKYQEND